MRTGTVAASLAGLLALAFVSPVSAAPFSTAGAGAMKVDTEYPVWSASGATGSLKSSISATSTGAASFSLRDRLSGVSSCGISAKYKGFSAPESAWAKIASLGAAFVFKTNAYDPSAKACGATWSAPGKYQYRFFLDACDAAGNCLVDGAGAGLSGISMAKVVGVVSSRGSAATEAPVLIVSNVSKFASKTAVHQRAQEIMRGMGAVPAAPAAVPSFPVSSMGAKSPSSPIVLFSGSVTIGAGSDFSVAERGTILAIGGDVYIAKNVLSGGKPFAIAAFSDAKGKGGNIYIDPSVTNIDAILFADRAVTTASGVSGAPVASAPNQLYIRGSILSENTIGGSKARVCPFFAKPCTDELAEKYDLNRLRDYHLQISGSGVYYPADGAKVAGGAVCTVSAGAHPSSPCSGGVVGEDYRLFADAHVSAMETAAPANRYAAYSTVIKYNPAILSNPPPLFGK